MVLLSSPSLLASILALFAIATATSINDKVSDEQLLEHFRKKKFPRKSLKSRLLRRLARLRGNKIVGGVEVEEGRYPYMASLMMFGCPGCGGTLVHPEWVLSAAHCAGYTDSVLIGNHDIDCVSENSEEIRVRYEIKHPLYDGSTLDNDVLMIRLEKPSSFDVVKLHKGDEDISGGNDVTVMGWGATSYRGPASDVLLEVEVQTVTDEDCREAYPEQITESMFCAGADGKDSCQGDSGGPVIIKGADASSDVQVGIVSWGYGCAFPGYPGVYAAVAKNLEFVESTIENEGFPLDGFDYSDCNITDPSTLHDYNCDLEYNSTECNNDGLDCEYCPYPDDGFDYSDCGISACFIGDGRCQDMSSFYSCNGDGGDCADENCDFPTDGFNYTDCEVSFPCWIGDGYCDTLEDYSTSFCNNDGGDCDTSSSSLLDKLLSIKK